MARGSTNHYVLEVDRIVAIMARRETGDDAMAELHDNRDLSRFEMVEQGHTSFADYHRKGRELIINHVEAPEALRGTGAASRLMQAIVDEASRDGLSITPVCSYAVDWMKRHRL
jgi:predicted GNAT family acetyltransferase